MKGTGPRPGPGRSLSPSPATWDSDRTDATYPDHAAASNSMQTAGKTKQEGGGLLFHHFNHHCLPIFPSEMGNGHALDDHEQQKLLVDYSLQPLHLYGDSNMINNASAISSSSYYDFSFSSTTVPTVATDHLHHGHGFDNDDEVDAGFWNELGPLLPSPPRNNHNPAIVPTTQEKTIGASGNANMLTRESVSRYFYMPITQAARELNVGLTLLKKRCRELGVKRWPHRKLTSLQTLISNVRRLQPADGDDDGRSSRSARLKEAIEVLEKERQLLEQCPDLQLQRNTKRLRQACFKANYKDKKKRNLRLNNHNAPAHDSNPSPASPSRSTYLR